MASQRVVPESANEALVSMLIRGTARSVLYTRLDLLLRWLASPDSPEASPLNTDLRRRRVEPVLARRNALQLLDTALFAPGKDDPLRQLGFLGTAARDQLRARYRLLMRIYHPDHLASELGPDSRHAERINQAYARARDAQPPCAKPSNVRASIRPRRRARSTRIDWGSRIRRLLGSPRVLQRRFLGGIALLCTSFMVHACVSSRTWVELPGDAERGMGSSFGNGAQRP